MQLRGGFDSDQEQFFIFSDRSVVKPNHVRKVLHALLNAVNLNGKLYNTQSFHAGRSCDLIKYGFSVEQVKKMGCWKSNAIYKYIKDFCAKHLADMQTWYNQFRG